MSSETFEELVESRIGFGSYQKKLIFLMSFIIMSDGIEVASLSLILPLLRAEWNISENLQGLMGSILFVGFLIGSLLSSFFSDLIGRKRCLTYISMIQFLLGIYSAFIHNVYIFILIRGLFGVLLGFVVPLVPALAAEWTPKDKRGKVIVIVTSAFSVGQVVSMIVAYFCLKDLEEGNWRLMLIICSFPCIFVWYGCSKFMLESPRYVMISNDIEEGIDILNHVIKYNQYDEELLFSKEKDIDKFEKWKKIVKSEFLDEKNINFFQKKVKDIFNKKYWKITLGLWSAWFGSNFTAYGFVFILPFFLNELDKESAASHGILTMLITTIGEASSGILAYFLVETETFGRKNSLALGLFVASICSLICFCARIENILILMTILTIARFFSKMTFTFLYPLTAEIYPTSIRTMGLGSASGFGRLSACIMPFFLIKLFYMNIYYPFLLIFFFSLLGLVGTWTLPYDTRGRCLDMNDGELNDEKILSKELLRTV